MAIVALSADGVTWRAPRRGIVRVATVADGRVLTEVQAESAVTALAFAPDAACIAVGDAAGTW